VRDPDRQDTKPRHQVRRMSESTRDQRMTPQLAPVAFVDRGKPAKEGKAMEDKGKGKAGEGQDTYGEGGSSGRGGGWGESTCRHGKQLSKCRKCRGEGEVAGEVERIREEPETQRREKRARTTQPRAIEAAKSAKEGKAMEDKGKGKAEEGHDIYGEGGSSGRGRRQGKEPVSAWQAAERECVCCLLVLNLVSSTLPCIRQPGPRLRVLDVCGFV